MCKFISRFIIFIFAGSLLFTLSCAREKKSLPQSSALDLSLSDLNGRKVSLKDYRGKILILSFWATWCKPCQEFLEELNQLYLENKEKGLEVVAIAVDKADSLVRSYVQNKNFNFEILIGNEEILLKLPIGEGIPSSFLIDRAGVIQKKYVGTLEVKNLIQDLELLL